MSRSKTQQLVEDLKALIKADARIKAGLPPAKVRDEISAARGVGLATVANKASGSGGGIAWPLTEKPGTRTYHPDRYLWDTSGLFAFAWGPTLKATFTDGNGDEGPEYYADPDA